MKIFMIAAALAALPLPPQAAYAAEDLRGHSAMVQQRTGAFAGGSIRFALGGSRPQRPQARLQAGLTRDARDLHGAGSTHKAAIFELGEGRAGKAGLYIGGADAREFKQRLGMSTGTAVLIGGGLLVGLLVVAVASAKAPEFDDCFDPAGC